MLVDRFTSPSELGAFAQRRLDIAECISALDLSGQAHGERPAKAFGGAFAHGHLLDTQVENPYSPFDLDIVIPPEMYDRMREQGLFDHDVTDSFGTTISYVSTKKVRIPVTCYSGPIGPRLGEGLGGYTYEEIAAEVTEGGLAVVVFDRLVASKMARLKGSDLEGLLKAQVVGDHQNTQAAVAPVWRAALRQIVAAIRTGHIQRGDQKIPVTPLSDWVAELKEENFAHLAFQGLNEPLRR